jgi:hypothetical protein
MEINGGMIITNDRVKPSELHATSHSLVGRIGKNHSDSALRGEDQGGGLRQYSVESQTQGGYTEIEIVWSLWQTRGG